MKKIGSQRGEDIRYWKRTVRVPVGLWSDRGARIELQQRLSAMGVPWYYRDPTGLEVLEQYAGCKRIGSYYQWLGFLWIGKQPKTKRPLCGARTRQGGACQAKAVLGKERCRLHGGLSTGAKTAEGRARISESNRRRAALKREHAASRGIAMPLNTSYAESHSESGALDSV